MRFSSAGALPLVAQLLDPLAASRGAEARYRYRLQRFVESYFFDVVPQRIAGGLLAPTCASDWALDAGAPAEVSRIGGM